VLLINSKINGIAALKFIAGFSLFIYHYRTLFLTVNNIFFHTMSSKYVINSFVWLKSRLISHVLQKVPNSIYSYFVLSSPKMNRQKGDYCFYSAPFTLKSLKNVLISIGKWIFHKVFDKRLSISCLTVLCPLIAIYIYIYNMLIS